MILLDTHVLVRYMRDEGKLGRRALSTIDRAVANDELFVSAISFWEVATLVAKRRLELDTTVAAFRDLAIRNGAREQVLDGDIATLAGELPDAHGDLRQRKRSGAGAAIDDPASFGPTQLRDIFGYVASSGQSRSKRQSTSRHCARARMYSSTKVAPHECRHSR